jgi:ABC-type multidrug transport system ATPase subunit
MNFVFFVISIARFEHLAVPVNLLRHPPGGTSDLEPIVQWVFFIIQIPGYQLLGALLERYFYGTASKARVISWQDEGATNSVTLSNFTKVYHPNFFHRRIAPLFGRRKETVIAVNNLTLTVAKGQIMVLLGANGSGKSTVIESIAGLNRPTSGSIDINGCSGIGICPQKNVLWDELTVEEHVRIFNRLKSIGPRDTKEETRELIKRCDMDRKIKARAKTLSGGQKRKLQLALMFTGGSRICCIDEVSSGLDPLSRRKIWDILLAERSRITQIFTTHYLDEADLLADHIAILSKGTLRAEGTSVALKNTMGTGYRVAVHHEHGSLLAPEIEGVSRAVAVDRTTYSTPDCAATGRLIDELESRSIHNYQVSGPTIEDVFLQLAEEVELEEKNNGDQSTQNSTVEHGKLGEEVNAVELHTLPSSLTNERGLALLTGKRIGVLLQAWMLLRKRVTIVQRNYLPSIAAFTIPIIAAGLVTIFVKGYSLGSCVPGDLSDAPDINSLSGEKTLDLVFGPSSSFSTRNFELLASLVGVHSISNATSLLSSVNFVESLEEFKDFINANFSTVTPGGLFLGNATQPPVFTYIGNKFTEGLYAPILVQSALDTLLTNITISAQFMPFATPLSVSCVPTDDPLVEFKDDTNQVSSHLLETPSN